MKLKISGLLFSLSILLFSCQKYLDKNMEGKVPVDQAFQTADQAKEALVGIYSQMRKWGMIGFNYSIVLEITSDNSIKGGVPGDAAFINQYDQFTFAANEGQINDLWIARYQLINLCNQAITKIPPISMDESLKNRLIAEAKFCRATFYFDLVRAFGDVPMPLDPALAVEASVTRTPESEVYNQIIADLNDAIAVLPDSYSGAEIGRATKGAARGYLAKVYLYLKQWDNVLAQTSAIISSGRYSLAPNFYNMFRVPGENGVESLFEVQNYAVAGNGDLSNSQYSQTQGIVGPGGYGWGFNAPSDNLAQAFDAAGDIVRKKATILYNGDIMPGGETILGVGINGMDGVVRPRYNGKAYIPISQQVAGVNSGAEQNVRKLRYAEILLIDAEAKLNKGDVNGAATSLNLVRARAQLLPIAAPTMQNIWNERRLELAMENDRFFDLVRTGQAAAVLGPLGFKVNKNERFPIPQTFIDVTNGIIKQNPGY
jgi:hypothetical protein